MQKIRRSGILLLAAILCISAAGCGFPNDKNAAADAGTASEGSAAGISAAGGGAEADGGLSEESGSTVGKENAYNTADSAGSEDSDRETDQTVTIKANPDGTVRSASVKTSEDDMETDLGEEAVKELPFAVSVRYYLDGKAVTAEEIAGKTGRVRIRFDYENRTKVTEQIDEKEVETIVPLAFLTAVVLPEDRFSDVSVTNGDVSGMQDNQIAIGYAMPGLEDSLGLDAVDDALDEISFDFDDDNDDDDDDDDENNNNDKKDKSQDNEAGDQALKAESVSETSDDDAGNGKADAGKADEGKTDAGKTDAGNKKNDSVGDGKQNDEEDGIPTYVEIDAYAENFKLDFTATIVTNGLLAETEDDTIDDLKDAVSDLKEISEAGDDLQDGTEELRDGAGKFRDGLSQYVGGAGSLAEGAAKLNEGVKKLDENGSSLADGAAQLSDALAELNKSLAQAGENLSADQAATDDESEAGTGAEDGAVSGGSSAEDDSAITGQGTGSDDGSMSGQSAGAEDGSAMTGQDAAAAGNGGLDAEALVSHAAESAASAVMEQLASDETLTEEQKAAVAQSAGMAAAMAAGSDLQEAVSSMSTSGSGQLSQLQSGIAQLAEGAATLYQGVQAYTDGVSQLADGTKQLSEGAGKLSSSGSQLLSGYDKMKDGIGELADGIKDMNQDGMQKIGDLADQELTDTLDQLRAMIQADRGHTALGVYDGTKGSVRYILETDEIK